MKLDLSLFTSEEIAFITSPYPNLTGEPLPYYIHDRYFYYNIWEGRDEIDEFQTSTTFFKYHAKLTLKMMGFKGYTLPYKFEMRRIVDPAVIAKIIEREKDWEF